MNASVHYLESLGAFDLNDQTMGRFISLLELEVDKEEKKAAAEFFLHVACPNAELTEKFIHSKLVQESEELQASVKIYVANMEYRAKQSRSSEEASWNLLVYELLNL